MTASLADGGRGGARATVGRMESGAPPNGKSLYVAVGPVWQYSINPATGELTPKSPATIAAPGTAHDLAIAPNGKNVYVVTEGVRLGVAAVLGQEQPGPATGDRHERGPVWLDAMFPLLGEPQALVPGDRIGGVRHAQDGDDLLVHAGMLPRECARRVRAVVMVACRTATLERKGGVAAGCWLDGLVVPGVVPGDGRVVASW